MTGTSGRMLSLLALLQSRREWSGRELAERLEVTDRTLRRDVGRLRDLGYPVHSSTGTAGGYRLASGRNLPPLLLDDDEAVAVAVGLLTAAGGSVTGIGETSLRALAKLEQILPARLRHQVAAVSRATVPVVPVDGPQVDATTLAVLARACRDHECVTFDYRSRDGRSSTRRVEPHHLVTAYRRWYLIAYDDTIAYDGRADGDGWRTFRIDRLRQPVLTGRRFAERELPAPDPATYLARALVTAPYRYIAHAVVQAPAATVSGLMYVPLPGAVQALDDESCSLRLAADTLDVVAQQVLSVAALGAEFRLDAAPELLEHLRSVTRNLAEATGD